mgnify:CR=1 FL=1
MSVDADRFAALIEPVARLLFGEPNKALSSTKELRFGKRGSLAVDIEHGRWFKHGDNRGGGVLDMIDEEKGLKGGEADPVKRSNKIAQAAKRHGERLMSLRVIMRENPFVWLTGRKVRGFAAPAGKSNVEDISLRPVGDLMSMDDDWPEWLP